MTEYESTINYAPTMELRFVERVVPLPENIMLQRTVRILQQKFERRQGLYKHFFEWRDVPLEQEVKNNHE